MNSHLTELEEQGFTVLRGVLPSHQVDALLKRTNAGYESQDLLARVGSSGEIIEEKILLSLQNCHKDFIDILDSPPLTAILMSKLNDPFYKALPADAPNYILSFYNARSSRTALALHTDTFLPVPGNQTWTVQASFHLERSTEANGALVVVPGSHRKGQFVDFSARSVPVCAEPGDVVLWDSRLWHGALANQSGESRWALIATFSCWWVKQRNDMPRTLPESIYRTLSDRQKALLGFCSIPPTSTRNWHKLKQGYDDLLPSVRDWL